MLLILLTNLLAGSVHCASVNEISKEYKSKFTNAEWDGNPTACVVKPYCYSHQRSNFMSTLKKGNDAAIESSFFYGQSDYFVFSLRSEWSFTVLTMQPTKSRLMMTSK